MRKSCLLLAICVGLLSSPFGHAEVKTGGPSQPKQLSFGDRVAYQRAIEEVYWKHRIWPRENPNPRPSLDQVMFPAQLEEKVENYLRNSQILQDYWQQPVSSEQLQAEMERMAQHTRQPDVLRELFAALGNDPFIVAECLARPLLSERLVTNRLKLPTVEQRKEALYSWRTKAKDQMPKTVAAPPTVYTLPIISDSVDGFTEDHRIASGTNAPTSNCSDDTWTATSITNVPTGRWNHSAIWTGSEMIVWGGNTNGYVPVNTGGRYNPATDTWTATSTTNAPPSRTLHTAVWTGSQMIVWGGANGSSFFNNGGIYNPGTDTWTATSTTNAPSARDGHTAVWTGSAMIVWGGSNGFSVNTGGRYNPGTDTWTATSTTNVPTGRGALPAVWTGNEMIVWGGYGSSQLNTGGKYNPGTDTWTATSTTNAPSARYDHAAVWTGSEMIVWGGVFLNGSYQYPNTGGRYNPGTDTWTVTSTINAPTGRQNPTAVWTGSEMTVWGGFLYDGSYQYPNTCGRYNPAGDIWTATSTTNAPAPRGWHTAVWTGTEMIVWGGFINGIGSQVTGGRYCGSASPTIMMGLHQVSPTASPSRIEQSSLNDTSIDAPLRLVPNEALLRNQPIVTGGLVADGVTPLLIEVNPNPAPTQSTTYTFNTVVNGGTVSMASNLNTYLRVLQQSGPQFVVGNSVVLSSAHPSGFAYISGIKSEDVQFASNSKELNVTLTATQQGQPTSATVQFRIRKPPIVLVHGYRSDNSTWYGGGGDFLGVLTNAFPSDFILPVEYGVVRNGGNVDTSRNRDGAFEYLAPLLDVELTRLVESSDGQWHQNWAFTRYNIVGHSQGGVLARMLCTSEDPRSIYSVFFQPFRSARNAYRGRFHRVITINSPHNGSTFVHYLLRMQMAGYLLPSALKELGILQDKFDPFGQQMNEINVLHWQVDPGAKFHLIGTTINGAQPPTIGAQIPLCYSLAHLSDRVSNQNYSRGAIVIPNGADGVVDFNSEFAGFASGVKTSIIPPNNFISHSEPTSIFGVPGGSTATESAIVANRIVSLLNGSVGADCAPTSNFCSFALQQINPALQGQIDSVVPPINPNGPAIFVIGSESPKRLLQKRILTTTYQFGIAPSADQQPASVPNWYADIFGPNGVSQDGVTVTPQQRNPKNVTVAVEDSVLGDVILHVNYIDINGDLVIGIPIVVVSRPPGSTMTGIELIPDTISLTGGTAVTSEIWADYNNAARSQLFIPNGASISYASDDLSIAGVDLTGKITLKAPGSTNVHVSYLGFSAQSSVTVSEPPPPPVIAALSAVSRKTHGAAGNFDIDLPLSGPSGIECRVGGASNDYQVVVTFASPISAQAASVTSGIGGVNNFTVNGSQITVNLSGITSSQMIVLTLSSVSNGTTTGDITVPMSVLIGDANGNGIVNSSDVSQTKLQVGQPVTAANFRQDVNANGSINSSDVSLVKSRSGTSLP